MNWFKNKKNKKLSVEVDTIVGTNIVKIKETLNDNRVISLFISSLLSYLIYFRLINI